MSKNQTLKAIRDEIRKINTEIDLRIIRGISYKDLSRRHRFLMSQLSQMKDQYSVFVKWFSSVYTLIF